MFDSLSPVIRKYLKKHHELYSCQCKAELWEEICSKSLIETGFGSDWRPDFNHKVGVDQVTDNGIKISNKGGKIADDNSSVIISGSRLTKHKTLKDKLDFLSESHQDYVFCLATNNKEWLVGLPRYYFIVIDSQKLDYHNQEWKETYSTKGKSKGKHNGYICESDNFNARISNSMSDQLWTEIKSNLFEEIHEIII